MNIEQRAESYTKAFPKYPPVVTHGTFLYGIWMIGANYSATNPLYGAYPRGYLKRVHSMFPDARRILHLYSGGLKVSEAVKAAWPDRWPDIKGRVNLGLRGYEPHCYDIELVDSKGLYEGRYPTWQGDVTKLPDEWAGRFDLVLCDPPYSKQDAAKYGVKLTPARLVIAEAARVTRPGGNLVWLDQQFPMHRKVDWKLWGTIGLVRSTMHRVRLVSIFERQC